MISALSAWDWTVIISAPAIASAAAVSAVAWIDRKLTQARRAKA